MKSKAYILMEIGELLKTKRGLCPEEIEEWKEENKEKTVYELLTIKKELVESPKEFPDISFTRWFRG
jgi:hypothetical protein